MLKSTTRLKKVGISLAFAGAMAISVPAFGEASEASLGEQHLQEGMEHEDVQDLQELLADKGYFEADTSDTFGTATAEAVTNYQKEHDLLVDGIAGTKTIGALQVVREGDEGQTVTDLQSHLQSLDHYDGKIDGIFGPITHQAVKDFQTEQDIQVDGLAGPETFGELSKLYYGKEEESDTSESSNGESSSSKSSEGSSDSSSSKESKSSQSTTNTASSDTVEEFEVEATAYTANCEGCTGVTATGIDLNANPDQKVIAVDPDVIPLGSTVEVEGYGTAVAGDVGGAIQGEMIDVYLQDSSDVTEWGRQTVTVRVLDE